MFLTHFVKLNLLQTQKPETRVLILSEEHIQRQNFQWLSNSLSISR